MWGLLMRTSSYCWQFGIEMNFSESTRLFPRKLWLFRRWKKIIWMYIVVYILAYLFPLFIPFSLACKAIFLSMKKQKIPWREGRDTFYFTSSIPTCHINIRRCTPDKWSEKKNRLHLFQFASRQVDCVNGKCSFIYKSNVTLF